ncbi:MAG TPA: hypothetical protein VHA37_07610, partial [Candidatus Saccharimonadales bacterium]|nr:hypothetical protein [Candidatus Saccharimonadales bacterium]
NELFADGYQAAGIAKQLGQRLREQLVEGRSVLPEPVVLQLLAKLIDVPVSHDPERFLEIALLEAQPVATSPPAKETLAPPSAPTDEPAKAAAAPAAQQLSGDAPFDETVWPRVLQTLKQHHNTLHGVVRMAQPAFLPDDTLQLTFAFAFHEKRLKEAANRQKLADVLYELTGKTVKVECVLDPSAKPPKLPADAESHAETTAADPGLDAISNIFGAAELLES